MYNKCFSILMHFNVPRYIVKSFEVAIVQIINVTKPRDLDKTNLKILDKSKIM